MVIFADALYGDHCLYDGGYCEDADKDKIFTELDRLMLLYVSRWRVSPEQPASKAGMARYHTRRLLQAADLIFAFR